MSGAVAAARREAEEALAEYDRLWGAAHATNAYGRAVVGLASALRSLLASEGAKETDTPTATPLDHVAFLTGLPVELNSLLPEGSIFMHPRTFHGLPAEHPSWLDRMRADAKKVTSALDGDGRDGFNGSGPFEG